MLAAVREALSLSHVTAWVLVAGGAIACLIAMGAIRLMTIYWHGMKRKASTMRMAHVTRPIHDTYGMVFWCVVYVAGGLVLLWGLWALGT